MRPSASSMALAAAFAWPAAAQDWQPLSGPAITTALERHVLRYEDGSEQFFNYGGLTEYRIGWPNEGRWAVRGDQYCSKWPPVQDWLCFDVQMSTDPHLIRFHGAAGQITTAIILPNPGD